MTKTKPNFLDHERPLENFTKDLMEMAKEWDAACLVLKYEDHHHLIFSDTEDSETNELSFCLGEHDDFVDVIGLIGGYADNDNEIHIIKESYVAGEPLDAIAEELRQNRFGWRISFSGWKEHKKRIKRSASKVN